MAKRLCILLFAMLLFAVPFTGAQDDTLTILTHDSFNVSEEVITQFEEETGIAVEIIQVGDAGTLTNQAVLSAGNPVGDLLFGIDNTFLGRALDADVFEPYQSPLLENVSDEFILDENVTPIDYGDVCINYDIAYFEENNLDVPASLQDLTAEAYEGLLVVQNPATSSPGLAFLAATVAEFGEDGDYTYLDFWSDLVDNDVLIVEDWTTAYYGEFTVAGGGDYPMVVSYASSPPAEVIFADPPVEEAPTASIIADGMCFRQIEFAGVLRGAANPEAAQQFIDFMLSETFQEDIPLQMFVFPVNPDAELPPEFIDYAELAENTADISFSEINEGRSEWIEAWLETVLD
jgi:thiamine transport system substrate-binding protein